MNLQGFLKLIRARWVTVAVTGLTVTLAAIALTVLTTPIYQASTRLFVSTASGGESLTDKYQGTLFSQERVLSYTELLTGATLAQRTIDKLGLPLSADELAKEVTAKATPDTVLINVTVLDESPSRARDIANALSDEFVVMARELETPEDGSDPNARVIVEQRASAPNAPVKPQRVQNIALGVAIGLLLGIALAYLRDYLDNTVKAQVPLEEVTHVGLVGEIPLDKERLKTPAITFESDNSLIAEAFRKLRTNLQFLAVDDPPRLIVVASSMPGEGKSTTAINLALALAEAEHTVVLVDGDLRRPMLDKYLNVVGGAGFSSVLSGTASLSDVLQDTGFARLSVLTSGQVPPNPSELLGSQSAHKVMNELRSHFDFVIVDSSPLLAVTDASILATRADGVLMIARFGKTKRDQLAQAVRGLQDVGAPLLGAVLTMAPAGDRGGYGYGYGYGITKEIPRQHVTNQAPRKEGRRRRDG